MAVGWVLMMTGCTNAAPDGSDVPTGEALYRAAAEQHAALAADMHDVLMRIHPGEWAVGQGGYGAAATSCGEGETDSGYVFDYVRVATVPGMDAESASDAAALAFVELGLSPQATVRGTDAATQHIVVAEGERIGRAVVTVVPAREEVRVTARTRCHPGSAHDLTALVLGEERIPADAWQRFPAVEGPDSVPQFYFPADGPRHFTPDGTPIQPAPVVSDPPVAPYGDGTDRP